MGIREKKTGIIASYTATALSLVIGGWLMINGHDNPRKYTSGMRVNQHGNEGAYAAGLACRQCHETPNSNGEDSIVEAFYLGSMITCVTSKCHGELAAGVEREAGYKIFETDHTYDALTPGFRERYDKHYNLHSLAEGMACTDCHSEHEKYDAYETEGWLKIKDEYEAKYESITLDSEKAQQRMEVRKWAKEYSG